ncbi:hypothetical protein GMDG_08680 [Pseudogymnoascus destructans 20631-21]|uniref:Uncharacterized protein n=1 Tax=Pseudogymnoascus destructans (strain ATCC MYA-4855 / 20631-21) TaxID=658429 RepID=L8G7K5_PSED2|nr:hypothetical protein GMDG_08680 [Pseudogymnoascus destructans 20631-21]
MSSPSPFTMMNQSQFEHLLTSDTEDINSPFEPALIFSQDDVLSGIEAPLDELLEKLPKSPNNRYVMLYGRRIPLTNGINGGLRRFQTTSIERYSDIWFGQGRRGP